MRNMGGGPREEDPRFSQPFFDGPQRAEQRTAIVLPERIFRAVLLHEVERLAHPDNERELERFFRHFFDPTVGAEERRQFMDAFQADPPRVVMGYPRTTGSWPIIAITHTGEEEAEDGLFLDDYMGETQPDENPPGGEDQIYRGGIWEQIYSIYVLATHPDVCLYLYHFAKLVLFGARPVLSQAGLMTPHFSGGELNPEEILLPDNAFSRVLTIRFKSVQTIPEVLSYRDGRRLRLSGIFGSDVVVEGSRGGVKAVAEGDDDGA